MRKALLIAALVAIVGATGLASGASGGGTAKLRVAAMRPLQVQGSGFVPAERVRVVLFTSTNKWVRRATATATGRFVVVFKGVPAGVDLCSTFRVTARGDRGSRAVVHNRPLAECPEPVFP